jgi:predicted dehydrogenase
MTDEKRITRRTFLDTTAKAGAVLGAGAVLNRPAFAAGSAGQGVVASPATARIIGANDRINVGLIGVGGRGSDLLRWVQGIGARTGGVQIVAVSDLYRKRLNHATEAAHCTGYLDYREILQRPDIDAVVVATPDHWHAPISIQAMEAGKDVYCEKPMTHTVEQGKQVHETVLRTQRVFQVGSQTTSSDQWWKARWAIQQGMIGQLVESQGSYHRNSVDGEWNYPIDAMAGPNGVGENFVDWKTWLGSAPERPWDADRFFRFRKYWDYSGGIATDLFYHVMAPLQICWGEPQFPSRVSATGGIWVFKDSREVPDTFMLVADYPRGHSLVLSSSMANNTHIPGLIRGHEGTIMIVPEGQFEGHVDHITVTPQPEWRDAFFKKYGTVEMALETEKRQDHMENFLSCMRTRQKPVLDSATAYKAMVTIGMGVRSYQLGKTLYFDSATETVGEVPPPSMVAKV